MSNKKSAVGLRLCVPGIMWFLRILLAVLYVLLVDGRGWIMVIFLCMIPVDIVIKRKRYIVLESILALFILLSLFPWFPFRQTINQVHFYLLRAMYEKEVERYVDLSEYDMISVIDYNGKRERNQVLVSANNEVTRYGIEEKNLFLYTAVYVEEKDDKKTIFFMTDGTDMSGFLYLSDESARELPGIEKAYGDGEQSGYCTSEYAEVEAGGFEPCKYQWIDENWLHYIASIS